MRPVTQVHYVQGRTEHIKMISCVRYLHELSVGTDLLLYCASGNAVQYSHLCFYQCEC